MSSQATYDSYDAVEYELPNGRRARAKPFTYAEGVKYWRLFERAKAGDPEAYGQMLDLLDGGELAERMGIKEAVDNNELAFVELFEVLQDFFSLRPDRPKAKRIDPTENGQQ